MDVFLGRLHPLLLHLPIGLLIGVALLELVALTRRRAGAPPLLLWAAALSAMLAAGTGLLLHEEGGWDEELLERHEWLGISVAVGAVLTAWLLPRRRALGRLALLLTLGVLLPAGHVGNTLVRGADWLDVAHGPAPEVAELAGPSFARDVQPILLGRCAGCHGETRQKAGLRLDSAEALARGGRDGPVIVPGDATTGELLRRLSLPLEDDDHMPPEGKPQPTAEEIERIAAWIAAGAVADADVPVMAEFDLAAAPEEALRALRTALVHVEPVAEGSAELWIDFAAVATTTTDESARALLEPLAEHVAELSLARSGITDATLELLARMPRLEKLDLHDTAMTSTGLRALAGHARLAELNLARTQLDDSAVNVLVALPALRRVHLWQAGLGAEALARLGSKASSEALPSAALESEPDEREFTFTPVNAACPVSGKPVDPAYAVVFEGRVVGFCCEQCPGTFWADPAAYAQKLP